MHYKNMLKMDLFQGYIYIYIYKITILIIRLPGLLYGSPHKRDQVMPLNYKALGNCGYEIVVIELKRAYPK